MIRLTFVLLNRSQSGFTLRSLQCGNAPNLSLKADKRLPSRRRQVRTCRRGGDVTTLAVNEVMPCRRRMLSALSATLPATRFIPLLVVPM
jgi:hypothetical protein